MSDDSATPGIFAVRGSLLLDNLLVPGAVVVEDGVIVAIHRGNGDLPSSVYDAEIVSPGLIDLQVNGGFGFDVGDDSAAIDGLSQALLGTGVTAWLPTIVTAPASFYPGVFAAFAGVDADAGAIPLGLHLEGPFISTAKKGAHQQRFIEAADDALFDAWLTSDDIRLVTLAPERDGGHERIGRLVDRGIVVSLGHTDSTFEQFSAGIDAGATKATHLFNAMSSIHHRTPGAMVAALVDDRVTAGLIADGIHAHAATLNLAVRAKGPSGIALVSDMMVATGLGPGVYHLGGQRVDVDEHSARLADGTLAGSILTMDQAIRNLVAWTGATAAEALHMATAVPARLLGLHRKGQIRVGADADLVLLDNVLHVQQTIVGGQTRYAREGEAARARLSAG